MIVREKKCLRHFTVAKMGAGNAFLTLNDIENSGSNIKYEVGLSTISINTSGGEGPAGYQFGKYEKELPSRVGTWEGALDGGCGAAAVTGSQGWEN